MLPDRSVTYVPGLYRTSPPSNQRATPYAHAIRVLIRPRYATGPGSLSRTACRACWRDHQCSRLSQSRGTAYTLA